jgi:hypothetical protein
MKRFLIVFLLICGMGSCTDSGKFNRPESQLEMDPITKFRLGDAFVYDSLKTYGFILIQIHPELLDFVPVQFPDSTSEITDFTYGKIKAVPINLLDPDTAEIGYECLSLMGEEDIREFALKFRKVKPFKLKKPYPNVCASGFTSLDFEHLSTFVLHNHYTWEGHKKYINVDEILIAD